MRSAKLATGTALLLTMTIAAPIFADGGTRLFEKEAAKEAKSLSAEDVSEEQLEAFTEAADEIASIRLEYANEIASRGTEAISEAEEAMVRAVEDQGLEVREYREIAYLAAHDGSFRKRLDAIETHMDIDS